MPTTTLTRAAATALLLALPLTAQAQLNEDFDDIATLPAAGWAFQNNSDPLGTTNWFQGNSAVFDAFNGAPNAYLGANFNNGAGVATISNWAMTPVLSLTNGSQFSFFTRTIGAAAFPDRLQLRMSTAGASTNVGTSALDVGDFTMLLLTVNPALGGDYPETWTQFTATLSGLAEPTLGRFAFRYFVEDGGPLGDNSNYIGIDAVSFTGATAVPEPATLALLGLGVLGLGASARRRRA